MLRRLAVAAWLLTGTAYAQSPDGSELPTPQAPPSLTTRDGTWTWGPQQLHRPPGNYAIHLNGHSAAGGMGSRLVVANGGHVYVFADPHWYLWAGRWQIQAGPPPLPPVTPPPSADHTLKVGPNETYKTAAAAVRTANADTAADDYVIEIAAGTYRNEFVEVNRPMTLKAVGGPVVLEATTVPSNSKAIIVANADLTVDGLTFTGVRNSTGNGAGIRDHNLTPDGKLTVRNSIFTGNDTGILTDNRSHSIQITIENSKFVNNGSPSIANPHALYVNSGRLKVTGSLFCGQLRGHNIKSRASVTEIIGNEIYDGAANPSLGCNQGSSGLAVDISNGGITTITNNKIIQGPGSPNFALMAYGMEGLAYQANSLVITGNTFSSPGTAQSTMLRDPHCVRNRPGSRIADNTYESIRTEIDPATCPVAR